MKRFKNLLVLFAIAFAFVVASKAFGSDTMYVRAGGDSSPATPTSAEDSSSATPTPTSSTSGAITYEVNYTAALITVESEDDVYYQIVKIKDGVADNAKVKSWVKVTSGYIDISTVTKECAVLLSTDNTIDKKTTGCTIVSLLNPVKSVKMKFDYSVENEEAEDLVAVIGELEIKLADGSTSLTKDTYSTKYVLQWKRGANGQWSDGEERGTELGFWQVYSMMRASNGTLYVRAIAANFEDGEFSEYTALPSKEAKVKVPKTAAAPKVKIDYKKGTVAIKNGMEFVYGTTTYIVPAYSKDASSTSGLVVSSASAPTTTKTKISALTVSEIAATINEQLETKISAGSGFSIDVRTSADANKKYASYYATVNLAVPAAAPNVTATIADGKLTLSESGASTANLEYIYDTADKAATNLAKGSFKAYSKSLSYDSNKVLYVRTPGDADKSVFPSEYRQVTATEVFDVTFKVTVSATSGEETVDTTEAMKATVTVGTKDVTEDGTTVTKGETVTYTVTVPEVSGFTATLKVDGTAKTLTDNKAEIKSEAINAAKEFKIEVTYTKVTE